MTLASLIRKPAIGNPATAISAIPATQKAEGVGTVAIIATIAVANSQNGQTTHPTKVGAVWTGATPTESFVPIIRQPTAPMTAEDEQAIRAWLAQIEETDPATIANVIDQCQQNTETRRYFTSRAADELPKPAPLDDRRTCYQCTNLIGRRCHAAKRGAIVASQNYEPIRDMMQRCEGYAPGADDADRRHGRERWPGLIRRRDA